MTGGAVAGATATQLFGMSTLNGIFFLSRVNEGLGAAAGVPPLLAHLTDATDRDPALRALLAGQASSSHHWINQKLAGLGITPGQRSCTSVPSRPLFKAPRSGKSVSQMGRPYDAHPFRHSDFMCGCVGTFFGAASSRPDNP